MVELIIQIITALVAVGLNGDHPLTLKPPEIQRPVSVVNNTVNISVDMRPEPFAQPSLFPVNCEVQPPPDYAALFVLASRRHPSLSGACDLAKQANKECPFERKEWCLTAVSGAGAVGPAQFMPITYEHLGIDPTDPAQAFLAQAKYMAWCQTAFPVGPGGRTSEDIEGLALGCYNFGRGSMFRNQAKFGWMRLCGALPHLPHETTNYILIIFEPKCPASWQS